MSTEILILAFFAAAAALSWLSVAVFNALPAGWLCDYGEKPGEELLGKRVFFFPHGAVLLLLYFFAFFALFRQYGAGIYFFTCCAAAVLLLLTGLADWKYRIIPDQFVLLLLLPALVLCFCDRASGGLFFQSWYSPVLGAFAGAALMLLMNLLGKALFRKDSLGSGDLKLFAAAGLFTGFPQVFLLFLLTIFSALFFILVLSAARRMPKDRYFPFGPCICAALLLFLAFHRQIEGLAVWYLSLC
jgi:prepilin signal peptidase PulO-like enzyme (type II secretory pathway)